MNRFTVWIIISIFTIFIGCTNQSHKSLSNRELSIKLKNETGKVSSQTFIIRNNDTFDREYRTYYDNGKLRRIWHKKDTIFNGSDKYYFKNGQIASKGVWYMGRKNGNFTYYDSLGRRKKIIQYILYQDTSASYPNQIVNFDSNGDIVKKGSCYIDYYYKKDTIKLGKENYWFKVVLSGPVFEKAYLEICDYDERYNLKSDTSCQIAVMKNFEVALILTKYVRGKNIIRGDVVNYHPFKIDGRDSMAETTIYFVDSFYVVP